MIMVNTSKVSENITISAIHKYIWSMIDDALPLLMWTVIIGTEEIVKRQKNIKKKNED